MHCPTSVVAPTLRAKAPMKATLQAWITALVAASSASPNRATIAVKTVTPPISREVWTPIGRLIRSRRRNSAGRRRQLDQTWNSVRTAPNQVMLRKSSTATTSCAMTVPSAAPGAPISRKPNLPKINM